MNSIKAISDVSDYEIYPDYLNFQIDDQFLDEWLDDLYPEDYYKSLVPTLLNWLIDEAEMNIVWERILPKNNTTTICPILMCPDDCDFYCSLVVAQIRRKDDVLVWERIGIDVTSTYGADQVGSEVQWLDKIKPLHFDLEAYTTMLSAFRKAL